MIYLVTNQPSIFEHNDIDIISIEESIAKLSTLDEISLDTETQGLDCFTKKLLLLQLGNFDFQILFDIESFNYKIPPQLKYFLNNSLALYILQNAKFDLKFLFVQDVILKKVYDTMLAETILTNGLQYSGRDLATLVMKYCGVYLDKSVRGDIVTSGLSTKVLFYGADDIKYLGTVKEKQLEQCQKKKLQNAFNLDNAFVIALAYTEFCGIKLDYDKWLQKTSISKDKALALKDKLELLIYNDGKLNYFSGMVDMFSGKQECLINWDSPKQVIRLFKEYGINVTLKEKGESKETVDAKVLDPQKKDFPILALYLDYKEHQKEVSTYGENWKKYINKTTGRIHTTYQQLMDTGRLSSGNKRDGTVNLQNIPSDKETRSCFIPEEGNELLDADYKSQEQVILANFSKEKNLLNFYSKGFSDMHSYVTFLMYPEIRKCTVEELTPEALYYIPNEHSDKRKLAKNAGFAINYGGNGATIAKNCNIPIKDGEYVYKSYFEAFPGLKAFFDLGFQKAEYYQYVQFNNVTGRKFFFSEDNDFFALKDIIADPYFTAIYSNPREIIKKHDKAKNDIQRLSQNYPIQGTAADITKYATILFFSEILKRNWWKIVKIVNLVHDEILVECPKELTEEVKEVLIASMEKAGEPFCKIIPLKADAVSGDHWVH